MQEIFHQEGKVPVSFAFLKMKDRDLANPSAQPRRKHGEMPSGPAALVMSSSLRILSQDLCQSHKLVNVGGSQIRKCLLGCTLRRSTHWLCWLFLALFWPANFITGGRIGSHLARFRCLKIFSVAKNSSSDMRSTSAFSCASLCFCFSVITPFSARVSAVLSLLMTLEVVGVIQWGSDDRCAVFLGTKVSSLGSNHSCQCCPAVWNECPAVQGLSSSMEWMDLLSVLLGYPLCPSSWR